MKKILLTVAGSMLIALATVQAQERGDTTRTKTDEPSSEYRTESGTQGETKTLEGRSGNQGQYWRDENRVSVNRDELPADLLQTLESDLYQGWENATIYRHKDSEDYMLVIQDNGEVRTFYFDKEGQAIDDQNQPEEQSGDMNQQDVSGQMQYGDVSQDPQWRAEDKVLISASKVPSTMLITLGDPKYIGWDKSRIYKNKSTNEYMIEIKDGTDVRTYYFDQYGNAKTYSGEQGVNETDQPQTMGPVQTDQPPSIQWRTEDRIVVESDELPEALRLTLSGDDKYKGWENSTIYRNRATNDYMIEVRDGSTTTIYYFDSDGQAKTMDDDEMDDNDGGRSGYTNTEEKIPTGAKTEGTTGRYKEWAPEDKVMITITEVPVSLRTTLSDKKYVGWEKSTIYRNRTTNEYLVEIKDGTDVKTYYFDKDGKAIVISTEEDQD